MKMLSIIAVLTFASWLGAGVPDAVADTDHERARAALEAGEVVPLRQILDAVERDFVGRIVEIELEKEGGVWIYEVKLLANNGAMVRLDYDARTASLRRATGRGLEAARRKPS